MTSSRSRVAWRAGAAHGCSPPPARRSVSWPGAGSDARNHRTRKTRPSSSRRPSVNRRKPARRGGSRLGAAGAQKSRRSSLPIPLTSPPTSPATPASSPPTAFAKPRITPTVASQQISQRSEVQVEVLVVESELDLELPHSSGELFERKPEPLDLGV